LGHGYKFISGVFPGNAVFIDQITATESIYGGYFSGLLVIFTMQPGM
jgi:hypothetical protein